jgi:pimeloyl-ACP methyl ester carboxylesterase
MATARALSLLPVSPERFEWRGHGVAAYRDGSGRPVLLIHSINAAASAFEMRGPFGGLRDRFTVHALDLLGYGNSDRPARPYSGDDYISLIGDYLAALGEPAAIVASSLGAAYAVAAADRWPERVSALALVCPVGIGQLAKPAGPVGKSIYGALRGPAGRGIFRALTTRAGVGYFLKQQAYHDPASITPQTLEGFYRTCRRPGAHWAPICFLTGLLNCDIRAAFARLRQPVLTVWGRQGITTPASRSKEFRAANPRIGVEVVDGASLLVQDERPQQFNAIVRGFLGG